MSEALFVMGIALIFLAGFLLGTYLVTLEARDLGYMEQCIGKIGWHWECTDD